ncbi:MAG TPA: LacI family DNA-binding transcriptional regulator [Gaiellaceae bacterium]|nr:LacI family DNA-binding transcriptional regulator [Gaiellaceae bacterium]
MSSIQQPRRSPGHDGAKRVTLADVARLAGVSKSAASFVLTGRREEMRISTEIESRVLAAARETGYRPNIVSRSLRTGTTHTIGFVSDIVATTPFAGNFIKGALEAARDSGYLLLIAETEGDTNLEQQLLEAMIDRQVDGIVFAAMYTRKLAVPRLLRSHRAALLNAVPIRPTSLPSVIPDELEAGRTAATTLLAAGHRAGIYLIGPGPRKPTPTRSLAAVERLHGITETLRAAGVKAAGTIGCEDWQPEFGHAAVRKILERRVRPRALICFNDRLALGAYNALAEAGIEVPGDTSVISFDDDPIASWLQPRLTTIAIPHYELGRKSIELLLGHSIDGRDEPSPVVRVPMPLRRRDSVQSPRGALAASPSAGA